MTPYISPLKRTSNSTNRDHDSDSSEGDQLLYSRRTDAASESFPAASVFPRKFRRGRIVSRSPLRLEVPQGGRAAVHVLMTSRAVERRAAFQHVVDQPVRLRALRRHEV